MEPEKNPETVRRERVRQLWRARPAEVRSYETGPLNFHKLEERFPELLPPASGDKYHTLRGQLNARRRNEWIEDGLLARKRRVSGLC